MAKPPASLADVKAALEHMVEIKRLAGEAGFKRKWLESDAKFVLRIAREVQSVEPVVGASNLAMSALQAAINYGMQKGLKAYLESDE